MGRKGGMDTGGEGLRELEMLAPYFFNSSESPSLASAKARPKIDQNSSYIIGNMEKKYQNRYLLVSFNINQNSMKSDIYRNSKFLKITQSYGP